MIRDNSPVSPDLNSSGNFSLALRNENAKYMYYQTTTELQRVAESPFQWIGRARSNQTNIPCPVVADLGAWGALPELLE